MKDYKITAIVMAAGQGKRMNSSVAKQFLTLLNKPILYYSLKAFEDSSVDDIILVTGRGQTEYCHENIIKPYQLNKVSKIVEGGKERYDSVYQGLINSEDTDYVLIHDGARPLITKKLIEETILEVIKRKACIVGTPVKDTIKVVDREGFISKTPDRSSLWSAQTPQAFEYQAIRKAYDLFYALAHRQELAITDDAMMYETFIKKPVKMILGNYSNIKVTVPEDLEVAETILKGILYENA